MTAQENPSEMPRGRWHVGLTLISDVDGKALKALAAEYDDLFDNSTLTAFRRHVHTERDVIEIDYDAYTDDEEFVTYLMIKWS